MKLLSVTLDSHFNCNLEIWLSILRKCKRICWWYKYLLSFILANSKYWFVWLFVTKSHSRLLDHSFNSIEFLLSDVVGILGRFQSFTNEIVPDNSHPLHKFLSDTYQLSRVTRSCVAFGSIAFHVGRSSTSLVWKVFFLCYLLALK